MDVVRSLVFFVVVGLMEDIVIVSVNVLLLV